MENKSFVAIDLETTGLDFEKDEIIEVALVRFENGVESESVDYLVKPTSVTLRPFIESLTGISNADLDLRNPLPPWPRRFIPLSVTCPLWHTMPCLIPSS